MGFVYAFGGFERFSILVFSNSPHFLFFFHDFDGGLKFGRIHKGTKPAIPR